MIGVEIDRVRDGGDRVTERSHPSPVAPLPNSPVNSSPSSSEYGHREGPLCLRSQPGDS